MTDTPDWEPSEAMIEATWIRGYLDMRTHPGTVEIIIAVRPLIIAEAKPQIEAAERERIAKQFEDWSKLTEAAWVRSLMSVVRTLKDSKL